MYQSLLSAFAFLLPTAFAAMSWDVEVGNGGLTFKPDMIMNAPAGSKINFYYYAGFGFHTVAQSDFSSPCTPSGSDAIFSGYIKPTGNEKVASKMFTITLNDTSPLWLYCSAPEHCESGMSMVVNPSSSGKETIEAYQKASKGKPGVSPPKVQGGVISENTEDHSSSGGSGMSTSMSASSTSMSAAAAKMTTSSSAAQATPHAAMSNYAGIAAAVVGLGALAL